jgi:hypothetical protein
MWRLPGQVFVQHLASRPPAERMRLNSLTVRLVTLIDSRRNLSALDQLTQLLKAIARSEIHAPSSQGIASLEFASRAD